jgi:hypothetical protein
MMKQHAGEALGVQKVVGSFLIDEVGAILKSREPELLPHSISIEVVMSSLLTKLVFNNSTDRLITGLL